MSDDDINEEELQDEINQAKTLICDLMRRYKMQPSAALAAIQSIIVHALVSQGCSKKDYETYMLTNLAYYAKQWKDIERRYKEFVEKNNDQA